MQGACRGNFEVGKGSFLLIHSHGARRVVNQRARPSTAVDSLTRCRAAHWSAASLQVESLDMAKGCCQRVGSMLLDMVPLLN